MVKRGIALLSALIMLCVCGCTGGQADDTAINTTETDAPEQTGQAAENETDGQSTAETFPILGLIIDDDGSDSALFGCVSGAGIRDLTVCGSTEGKAAASYAAGVLAYADASVIQNCTAYVDVTAAGTHAGGLAAYICNGTTVESCGERRERCGRTGRRELFGRG